MRRRPWNNGTHVDNLTKDFIWCILFILRENSTYPLEHVRGSISSIHLCNESSILYKKPHFLNLINLLFAVATQQAYFLLVTTFFVNAAPRILNYLVKTDDIIFWIVHDKIPVTVFFVFHALHIVNF